MTEFYSECMDKVIEQVNWWYKIGKIETIDKAAVEEAIEVTLTEDEAWECYQECGADFASDCLTRM